MITIMQLDGGAWCVVNVGPAGIVLTSEHPTEAAARIAAYGPDYTGPTNPGARA